MICVLRFPVNLSGDCQISSVENCLLRIRRGVEGVVGEVKSVSWGGAKTKGEVHKRELTKNMLLHSDLLTSLTSSLTPLQRPGMCTVDNFQRFRFGNSRSPDKFTGKR